MVHRPVEQRLVANRRAVRRSLVNRLAASRPVQRRLMGRRLAERREAGNQLRVNRPLTHRLVARESRANRLPASRRVRTGYG